MIIPRRNVGPLPRVLFFFSFSLLFTIRGDSRHPRTLHRSGLSYRLPTFREWRKNTGKVHGMHKCILCIYSNSQHLRVIRNSTAYNYSRLDHQHGIIVILGRFQITLSGTRRLRDRSRASRFNGAHRSRYTRVQILILI